jgi:hypothetical protein
MPVISHIDQNSDEPIRRFIGTASNYRLQLAAVPDTRDPTTGQILKGEHQVAQFKRGLFETNKPELIKRIENAYSYGTDVKDYDVLLKEGKDRRYADLLAMAKDDPEMMERLKKDLAKRSTKDQKARAAKIQSDIETEASPAV